MSRKFPKNNIKEYREEWGMTQQDLAVLLGIAPSTMAKKESGQRPVTIEEARKLSNVFQCSIDDLFEKGGPRNETAQ